MRGKFRRISDEEMRELDEDPRVPMGRGLIDGMIYAEDSNEKFKKMFGDSVFGNTDKYPEKWTSDKRGKRLNKQFNHFKKSKYKKKGKKFKII